MALRNQLAVARTGAMRNSSPVQVATMLFTENGAGVYSASVRLPPHAVIVDIIISALALWTAATSALMVVGDFTAAGVAIDEDGFFIGVNLKATDLLAGESVSFARDGGKAGAYNVGTNTHWTNRYLAAERTITGKVTSVGAGTAGRTVLAVVYALPLGNMVDARKA